MLAHRLSHSVGCQRKCVPQYIGGRLHRQTSCSCTAAVDRAKSVSHSRRSVLVLQSTWFVPAVSVGSVKAEPTEDSQKTRNLSIGVLKDRIVADFQDKQYYVTGHISPEIYKDNCLFTDPTTRVTGWRPYTAAVSALFDPEVSRADLISVNAVDPHTIELRWRLEGALKLPGRPRIKPYTGTTLYRTDEDGLVASHSETWDISTLDAVVSLLWPSFGAPAAAPIAR